MKTNPAPETLTKIAVEAKYFALVAERNALLNALELAVATIERIAVRHGPFSSVDGTLSVARAAIERTAYTRIVSRRWQPLKMGRLEFCADCGALLDDREWHVPEPATQQPTTGEKP